MTDKKDIFREDQDVIKDTDIIFDCPHCNKSLAIDYRGAGLTIQCSDCFQDVAVPIPDGMELTDIDSSDEEQEVKILNLRRSLSLSEHRVSQLESEIEELNQRREHLEKSRTDSLFVVGSISEQLDNVEKALEEISRSIRSIRETVRNQSK